MGHENTKILTRTEGWETRYRNYLSECREKEFAWGTHDCLMFPAGGVQALTGIDPAASYRGAYASPEEAQDLLLSLGYADQREAFHDTLGIPLNNVMKGQRGDVLLARVGDRLVGGLVDESGLYGLFISPTRGIFRTRLNRGMTAWRIF